MIASSPEVHTFFCLWRVNKKLPEDETSQNAFHRARGTFFEVGALVATQYVSMPRYVSISPKNT